MKLLTANFKRGIAKVKIETLEDLWCLNTILDAGTIVKGSTVRKIKVGGEEKSASYKQKIFIALSVESVDFSHTTHALRIAGTIVEGPEDVSRGSHHTLTVEINDSITINKEPWLGFQIEKLKEATTTKIPAIIMCIFDREEAFFASMTKQGYAILGHIKGDVIKKRTEHKASGDFYKQIIEKIKTYDQRLQLDKIILASPSFWKEELLKTLGPDDIRKKLVLATCSSVDETAFNEVLKREETHEALRQDRMTQELKLVDQILTEIARNGAVVYGVKAVHDAADAGAVRVLIVTDKLIQQTREQKTYYRVEEILRTVDTMKGTITIIHSDHAGGKKIDGLGGTAALLRYKI